jgi:hypothetical protein
MFREIGAFLKGALEVFTKVSTVVIDLAKTLAPYIGKALQAIIEVIGPLAEALKVMPSGMSMEEYGDRMLQMEESGNGRCINETDDEFLSRVKAYPLDEDLSAKLDLEQKRLFGVSYAVMGLNQKYSTDILPLIVLLGEYPECYDQLRVEHYIKMSTQLGVPLSYLNKYFLDDLSVRQTEKVKELIYQTERSLNPTTTDEAIRDFISRQL